MEKKQTAVEWLVEQMDIKNPAWLKEKIQKAKEMEKEQIEDAWLNGMKSEIIAPFGINRYKPEAEEYYNETYGGAE
jgi:hypothetical protein